MQLGQKTRGHDKSSYAASAVSLGYVAFICANVDVSAFWQLISTTARKFEPEVNCERSIALRSINVVIVSSSFALFDQRLRYRLKDAYGVRDGILPRRLC